MDVIKFQKINFACVVLCLLFSLTTLSFNADISVAAFPLSVLFSLLFAYVSQKKVFSEKKYTFISAHRIILQYMPYVLLISFVLRRAGKNGTSGFIDFISVLFWLLSSVLILFILHYMNPKCIAAVSGEWKNFLDEKKSAASAVKLPYAKKLVREIVSWIDALVQAVFMVLLLNIFIVQLYEIPSESMVPEFLIRDRVIVFKSLSGPKFPLSEIGFPYLKSYRRGDIVIFRNPHYESDRHSEVKTFVSQLVYMCTLTRVNLNVEADGTPKADPLVKRVCGMPGEQLMLQDGVLYARTSESESFVAVEDDSKWAAWNLNEVKPPVSNGIQLLPLSQDNYEKMLAFEEERRNLSIESVEKECRNLAAQFRTLSQNFKKTSAEKKEFVLEPQNFNEYYLFTQNQQIAANLLSSVNGSQWFSNFMTEWIENIPNFAGDLYAEANFKLNLMVKIAFGRLVVRDLYFFSSENIVDSWKTDAEYTDALAKANLVHQYVASILDRRNMPVFPADDDSGNHVYIPENCYFMMGDNRFNSLDMRHSYESRLVPLASADPYSALYYSDMAPQYVNRNRILGTASYRFWPLYRIGKPGLTGKK